MWHAIREATHGEPLAVWLLSGGEDRELSVDQFVLQDGRVYKTQEAHERLQTIFARLDNPNSLTKLSATTMPQESGRSKKSC